MTPAKARALGVQVGAWWNPSSPDDVHAEQARVRGARDALSAALVTSPPSGDPAAIDAVVRGWNATQTQIDAYLLEEPSVFWWTRDDQVKRGQNYEGDVEKARQAFARLNVAVPSAPPAPPAGGSGDFFHDLNQTAMLAIVAALVFFSRR